MALGQRDRPAPRQLCAGRQHAYRVSRIGGTNAIVGGDKVGFAVAIEVGHCHGMRRGADLEPLLGSKGAIAVAQEHTHRVAAQTHQ